MRTHHNSRATQLMAWLMAVAIFAMPLTALAQTDIKAPSNKYSVSDDVKLGRDAAQQVEQQLPILRDGVVDDYVERVGRRLVAAIPPEFQHSQFRYSFDVVNTRDINAFALPGGPMFINRGMIEAARSEGEMAGVMAHEISHVALRHATAQATETQKFQIGSVLGQIAGAVIGGGIGQIIGAGSQIGFGIGALKYSRKYETQADILGAQIMARAGYDPRDLANMFRTIERQSGGGRGGPEWLSSHPNPGNRYERINQEAAQLRVNSNNATQDTRAFQQVQARLRSMGRAPSMEEAARSGGQNPSDNRGDERYPSGGQVAYPSTRYRTYSSGDFFRVSVPDNWRELGGGSSITYAPEGAYGQLSNGQSVFTHGVMVGVAGGQGGDLRQSTDAYINQLLRGNPYLRAQSRGYQRASINGRAALSATFAGRAPSTGQTEVVNIVTTQLRDGNLFYMAAVAPQNDYRNYQSAFNNILRSIQLNDR
ncbi:MAG: M48 family metallopeptidase [Acidobacteria bacterium]|nr:M48 family metallopeptidase [Acidobacteriota bacterium]